MKENKSVCENCSKIKKCEIKEGTIGIILNCPYYEKKKKKNVISE